MGVGGEGEEVCCKRAQEEEGKHRSSKVERRDKIAAEIAGFRRMGREPVSWGSLG